jgi:hypothetical protein
LLGDPVAELLPIVLTLGVVLLIAWRVAWPPAVFVVRVRDAKPFAVNGKVTDLFLTAVAEVFDEFQIRAGEVRGIARGDRIALTFSPTIPRPARQRLRNWWAMSGWSARPARR